MKAILFGALIGVSLAILPLGTICLLVFLIILYFVRTFAGQESRRFLTQLLIIGFALRLILAAFNYYAGITGRYQAADTQPDAIIYNGNAFYLADVITGGRFRDTVKESSLQNSIALAYHIYEGRTPGINEYQFGFYVHLLGALYTWFGYSPIAAKALNSIFGCLSALLVYYIANILVNSKPVAKASATITMFLPSMTLWSVTLLRDSIVDFLYLLYFLSILLFLTKDKTKDRRGALILAVISFLLLWLFKLRLVLIFVIGLLIIVAIRAFRRILRLKILISIIMLVCLFIIFSILIILFYDPVERYLIDGLISIFNYHKSSVVSYPGASYFRIYKDVIYETAITDLKYFSDLSIFFSICKGLAYYIFSPFPWIFPRTQPSLLLFYPQATFTFIAAPFMVLGILSALRKRPFIITMTISILILGILPQAMAEAIVGNVVRHRDMFMPFIIIFSCYGFYLLLSSIKNRELNTNQ